MDLCMIWLSILAYTLIYSPSSVSTTTGEGGGSDDSSERNLRNNNEIIDLPLEHLPFYYSNLKKHVFVTDEEDQKDDDDDNEVVKAKPHFKSHDEVCWGYEEDCEDLLKANKTRKNDKSTSSIGRKSRRRYSIPICDGDSKGWAKSKAEQLETFYTQADFGYVKKQRDSIQSICIPEKPGDSSLECSEYLQFCRGRNLVIDFRYLGNRTKPIMYDTDVLSHGQIGGHCKLNSKDLKEQTQFVSSLQSWAPELQHFVALPNPVQTANGEYNAAICDQVVDRRMFIMKIDATMNMYHHFCDFFNLYASLHTNLTKEHPQIFSKDVQVLIWRSFKYRSSFEAAFSAFTSYPILDLSDFVGKRVCFSNVVFPLLPRMIYGLYYNTPLIWGCRNSGLFHAFSKFMLHRLGIRQRTHPDLKQIRVTFLSRKTKYRRVLNEDVLLAKLKENPELDVRKVEFTYDTDFLEQVQTVQDTDIFIGIHGAGLTHMLFLPDWAVVLEIYHCEDPNCYADLARLRGLKYLTWRDKTKLKVIEKDPELESNHYHKHANYKLNPGEFVKIANEAVDHVKSQSQASNINKNHEHEHDEL